MTPYFQIEISTNHSKQSTPIQLIKLLYCENRNNKILYINAIS